MQMRWIAGILGLVVVLSGGCIAQSQPVPDPTPVLKATTRLVIVDVVATNSKGELVSGLAARDFKLLENGKEQEIRVFDFQQPDFQHPIQVAVPAKPLPANVFTNVPAHKPGSALNVILLDSLNTVVPRQAYVQDQLLRFLEKFNPQGPVALYMLGSSLRLIQDFTDDPQTLKSAALRLDTKASPLLDNKTGGPPLEAPVVPGTPVGIERAQRAMEQQSRSFSTAEQINITLDALFSIARGLASHPGRKNLIWISDGFPFYINLSPDGGYSRKFAKQASEADNELMDAQVAVYPIDAHALQASTVYQPWNHDAGAAGSMSHDFQERLAVRSTMEELAAQTGGEAFHNTNSIDLALHKSMSDGSTYYTLGYYPQDKLWNGKFRKIEVKLNRPGVSLRYRMGYYALEPAGARKKNAAWAVELHEALDLNSPISSALPFQAQVIGPSEKAQKNVVVNFALDPRMVHFERSMDGLEHATVECAVEAYSDGGKLIQSEATTVDAALTPEIFERIKQSYLPCRQVLELPAGNYRLRLGVVDDKTGLIGTADARATVPGRSASNEQ